ncbi:hypothetical protein GS534_00425 [Rhodococcus hoagii]|nr:hypothetical protein [Prescottella equi]NKS29195.1 hypothetical protein [Prescottella equi]
MVGALSSLRGNRERGRGVEPGMDETAAWDLALWQLEMDQWFREQGTEPP